LVEKVTAGSSAMLDEFMNKEENGTHLDGQKLTPLGAGLAHCIELLVFFDASFGDESHVRLLQSWILVILSDVHLDAIFDFLVDIWWCKFWSSA
jgi:hypothetical protein